MLQASGRTGEGTGPGLGKKMASQVTAASMNACQGNQMTKTRRGRLGGPWGDGEVGGPSGTKNPSGKYRDYHPL